MKTLEEFVAAYERPNYWWAPLDRIILDACREHPTHTDEWEVAAKVMLINRTYRTNIQMRGHNAELKLARHFVENKADHFLAEFSELGAFRREIVARVVDVHERFVGMAYDVTKRVEISFCAKYLSFHFPGAVPIFDSYAYRVSQAIAGSKLSPDPYKGKRNALYGYHCEALLGLIDALQARGVCDPDIKRIDCVLYSAGGGSI